MLLSAGDRFLNACISTFLVHCAMRHCPFGCSLILQATLFTDVASETYSLEELKLVERLRRGHLLSFNVLRVNKVDAVYLWALRGCPLSNGTNFLVCHTGTPLPFGVVTYQELVTKIM